MTGAARPRVTLKLATSLDGRIALANGASQWITGPESRAEVHRMRAAHEAILTGIGTVLADNPRLTARPEGGCDRQPDVVIMDSRDRTPSDAAVFAETGRSVTLVPHGDLARAVAQYNTVMIEAGAQIAAAAIAADLVDRIEWFRAPVLLGGDGLAVVAALGLETLEAAPIFKRTGIRERGADLQESYERIR
ncbi:RibD family protein [Maricaulis sp.]|uniref:RibD family protein n=1 Tax=Maricaulis sp. TaxID=1486257 RepID=UPI001B21F98E|nr:RibD family protein [Maricaulis sp.]MBO6766517.1 RibD family protein [Maricaulis sp.]